MRQQRSRNSRTKQTRESESDSETLTSGSENDNEDISHISTTGLTMCLWRWLKQRSASAGSLMG